MPEKSDEVLDLRNSHNFRLWKKVGRGVIHSVEFNIFFNEVNQGGHAGEVSLYVTARGSMEKGCRRWRGVCWCGVSCESICACQGCSGVFTV